MSGWERKTYPRFRVGERVALTKAAIRGYIVGRARPFGVVTSLPPGRMSVVVRLDGHKNPSRYWRGFFRHLRRGEA